MARRLLAMVLCLSTGIGSAWAQGPAGRGGRRARAAVASRPIVLEPARVFDGVNLDAHEGWAVVVRGDRIETAGPAGEVKVPEGAARHRPARHDAAPRPDRPAHARVAPSVR